MLSSVTKHVTFDSAHYLLNPAWDRETNMQKFHKCCLYKKDGSDQPHGHTYHLEVTVTGVIDSNTGFVIDFKDLKAILNNGVLEKLDHNLINSIGYFTDKLATAENICHYIWQEIAGVIDSIRPGDALLSQIKLYETPDSFALLTREMVVGVSIPSVFGTSTYATTNYCYKCGGACHCVEGA